MPLAKREQLKGALASQKSPTSSSFTKQSSPNPSLVIGVGAGALYMLISCHEEMRWLNKTVEQTEHLLLELREQWQHHCEDLLSLSCSGSNRMHSTNVRTALSQGVHASMDQTGQRPFARGTCNRDSLLEEQMSATPGVAKDQMAALAAELEAELELMELNINTEDIILDQSLIHDAGEVSSKGLQNSYYSDTSSHGVVEASNIGRHSAHTEALQSEYGVSPIELDHRLREVLEAQQQERILELEQLLKETEAKLLAKEHEILSWKNHVNSLANLVQHASACGTHLGRSINGKGTESATLHCSFVADVPEVTKNTLEILHSFQDPPLSTQVEYGESTSSSILPPSVSKQETGISCSSTPVFFNDGNSFDKASYSSTFSHEGSLVRESSCCWDGQQGTGIDTPDFVVLDDFDAHTAAQKSETFSGQAVSKALEISDYTLLDEWINEMHASSHGFNGYLDSLFIDVDGKNTSSSGVDILPSSLHHMSCKIDRIGTSPSSSDSGRTKELEDSSDVKHIVNSFKRKPAANNQSSVQEGIQALKRGLKLKNESIQVLAKSASQEGLVEVESPVLDKIRHYEALLGNVRGKRS